MKDFPMFYYKNFKIFLLFSLAISLSMPRNIKANNQAVITTAIIGGGIAFVGIRDLMKDKKERRNFLVNAGFISGGAYLAIKSPALVRHFMRSGNGNFFLSSIKRIGQAKSSNEVGRQFGQIGEEIVSNGSNLFVHFCNKLENLGRQLGALKIVA